MCCLNCIFEFSFSDFMKQIVQHTTKTANKLYLPKSHNNEITRSCTKWVISMESVTVNFQAKNALASILCLKSAG